MATVSSSPSNKNKEDVQSSDLTPTAPPPTAASTAAAAPAPASAPAASQSEPAPSEPKEKVTPDTTPPKGATDEPTKSSERKRVWKARAKKTKKALETISDVVGGIITFVGIILCISDNNSY